MGPAEWHTTAVSAGQFLRWFKAKNPSGPTSEGTKNEIMPLHSLTPGMAASIVQAATVPWTYWPGHVHHCGEWPQCGHKHCKKREADPYLLALGAGLDEASIPEWVWFEQPGNFLP